MNKERERVGIKVIAGRMPMQRKIPMMLVHGEKNEKIKYEDASDTYIYFRNLYSSKPNNFMFFQEKDGNDQLSDEFQNHVRKWFVKQVKLGQYDSYWTRAWSKKFKFMLFCGLIFYLFICYVAFNLKDINTDANNGGEP